jgi:FkbM family methyltransferase
MRTIFPEAAEERLKAEFFGSSRGFFVDVGANDPHVGSQSFALEQAGWQGVLIEPQPDLAAKLRENRAARVFAAACSSPGNAGKTMPLYLAGMLSSLDSGLVVTGMRPHGAVEVPIRTLDDMLTEAAAPAPIDFLSIDIEGHEIEAFAGFDFARWRPRLILMEDHITSLAKHRLLLRSGYRLIRRTGLNGWYVPAKATPRLGLLGWCSLARKYYLALPIRMLREAKRRLRDRVRYGRATAAGPSVG